MNREEAFELLLSFSMFVSGEAYGSVSLDAIHAFLDDMGMVRVKQVDIIAPGDRVKILVGGPHENYLREATVSWIQADGEIVVYFGDQDEDEWVYSSNELEKVS